MPHQDNGPWWNGIAWPLGNAEATQRKCRANARQPDAAMGSQRGRETVNALITLHLDPMFAEPLRVRPAERKETAVVQVLAEITRPPAVSA